MTTTDATREVRVKYTSQQYQVLSVLAARAGRTVPNLCRVLTAALLNELANHPEFPNVFGEIHGEE